MLRKLYISNYAIINEAEIDFSEGMNIITGETGAGKSILLGALGLILGARADSKVLYDKSRKCVVEGHFAIGNYALTDFFETHEIESGWDGTLMGVPMNSNVFVYRLEIYYCNGENVKETGNITILR